MVYAVIDTNIIVSSFSISPIQHPHYFSSSYAYMFFKKKNYYRF